MEIYLIPSPPPPNFLLFFPTQQVRSETRQTNAVKPQTKQIDQWIEITNEIKKFQTYKNG